MMYSNVLKKMEQESSDVLGNYNYYLLRSEYLTELI
jgi:hypothetical protein